MPVTLPFQFSKNIDVFFLLSSRQPVSLTHVLSHSPTFPNNSSLSLVNALVSPSKSWMCFSAPIKISLLLMVFLPLWLSSSVNWDNGSASRSTWNLTFRDVRYFFSIWLCLCREPGEGGAVAAPASVGEGGGFGDLGVLVGLGEVLEGEAFMAEGLWREGEGLGLYMYACAREGLRDDEGRFPFFGATFSSSSWIVGGEVKTGLRDWLGLRLYWVLGL